MDYDLLENLAIGKVPTDEELSNTSYKMCDSKHVNLDWL